MSDENENGNENENNDNKLNVNDSLLEYYTLKNAYERKYYDKYISPIVLSNSSKLKKRQKFQELNKPECINCKQPFGTIFERKYYEKYEDKPEVIVFTARCGNVLNPCDLNIEIHKSVRESYDKLISDYTEILNDYQMKIIKLKNKILFLGKNKMNEQQYIDEFESYKSQILYYSEKIGEYTEENILINDNPEDNLKLNNLIASLNQQEIIQFKTYIKKYMETDDDNLLSSAMNMYIKEIIPKLKEIRDLKYKTMYIHNDGEGKHILMQSKYSYEGMNFYDEYVDEVVNFIKGSKVEDIKKSKIEIKGKTKKEEKEKKKSSKTLKSIGKSSKNKTQKKKLKISDEDIIKEEEEEKEEEEQEEEQEIFKPEVVSKPVVVEEEEEEELFFPTPKIKPKTLEDKKTIEDKNKDEDEDEEELTFKVNKTVIKDENKDDDEEELFFPTPKIKQSIMPSMNPKPKKIGKKIILNEATEAMQNE